MMHHIWQRNGIPPWEVLNVEWSDKVKSAWYFASMHVRLESGDPLLVPHDKKM